jgi:hypothetical protein
MLLPARVRRSARPAAQGVQPAVQRVGLDLAMVALVQIKRGSLP